jgi:hypothetical protein
MSKELLVVEKGAHLSSLSFDSWRDKDVMWFDGKLRLLMPDE